MDDFREALDGLKQSAQGAISKISSLFGSGISFKKNSSSSSRVVIRQHDLTDCGAACLASIAAYYGLKMPIARIRQYASTDQQGTNLLGLVEAAKKLKMTAKCIKGPFDSIFTMPYPVIVHVIINKQLQHYIVVYGANQHEIKVMDPAKGTLEQMPVDEFKAIWTGIAMLIAPVEEFETGDETVPVMSRFRYLLKPHRSTLVQIIVGAIVYTVMGLATAIYMQKILDNVLPNGNQNLLNLLSIIMIGILLLQLFINYTKTVLTVKTGQQIDARLILGYYKHLLRLPQQFFDTMRVGEIISRMNDAVKIRAFINDVLITLAVNIFIVIFSFTMMFTSYWKLALILFLVVPLYAIVYFFSNRINKKTQRKLMESTADLEAQLVESINSIGTIKRFGLEEFANVKTETRFIKLLRSIYKSSVNGLIIGSSTSFISGLFTIILLWSGASFVLDNTITPGELLSFYALMGYFTSPVISLIGMNKTMQDALIAADRLFEIMDLEREATDNKTTITHEMMGEIVFKDVSFRYGTRDNVFESLDLEIGAGKTTAIVGESGCGKTTLLSLLQNIYPIQAGKISIGDHDLKYISNDSLRALVSVVPQKVDLFNGDVIENIAVGTFEPDFERVIAICKQIGILDFIEDLPDGFKTHLGENGTNLSGGQRQRLAIARALYRDPDILILDEATSALDSLSEQNIQKAINELRNQGKTIILIAHRLSTVMNADKIVVMHKGKVIEEGPHGELLAKQGAYYKLWEQQFPIMKEMAFVHEGIAPQDFTKAGDSMDEENHHSAEWATETDEAEEHMEEVEDLQAVFAGSGKAVSENPAKSKKAKPHAESANIIAPPVIPARKHKTPPPPIAPEPKIPKEDAIKATAPKKSKNVVAGSEAIIQEHIVNEMPPKAAERKAKKK
jgi:ABC-type bacteriocin transporter